MKTEIQPIKRSAELAPLSREHHDGLLFVWKVRQGLRNGTDITLINLYVQWYYENALKQHFKKEEEVLAPQLPADEMLLQRMLNEHEIINDLIKLNEKEKHNDLVAHLADVIYNHIRFEERQLFQYAEATLAAETMKKIYEQLDEERQPQAVWKDEFWMRK